MDVKLLCARCHTPLVPAFAGLRCPRLAACGRGGFVEKLPPAHAFPLGLAGPDRARA